MDVGLPVRLMSYLRIFDTCDDGGNNMKKNFTNSRYKVGVKETYVSSEPVPMSNGILFNPVEALRLEDGYVLSPATILEHEFGHVVARKEATNDITPDPDYTTAIERRIIQGEELVTAKANGELPQNHKGRKSHSGSTRIIGKNSISTKEVSEQKSEEYRIRVKNDASERRKKGWTSEP